VVALFAVDTIVSLPILCGPHGAHAGPPQGSPLQPARPPSFFLQTKRTHKRGPSAAVTMAIPVSLLKANGWTVKADEGYRCHSVGSPRTLKSKSQIHDTDAV
jgi:hypothetical protein